MKTIIVTQNFNNDHPVGTLKLDDETVALLEASPEQCITFSFMGPDADLDSDEWSLVDAALIHKSMLPPGKYKNLHKYPRNNHMNKLDDALMNLAATSYCKGQDYVKGDGSATSIDKDTDDAKAEIKQIFLDMINGNNEVGIMSYVDELRRQVEAL